MSGFRSRALPAAAVLALCLVPLPALADLSSISPLADPTSAFTQIGTTWFTPLRDIASKLYIALFTIELIVVGYNAVLFKDNIAEFFQTFIWKFAMAFAMLSIIANAGNIFPAIVKMFQQTAQQTISQGNNVGGTIAATDPTLLEGALLAIGANYFAAADIAKQTDNAGATGSGVLAFGTGDCGLAESFAHGHDIFEMFCVALGMTIVTAAMAIFFTFLLLTLETQIVLSVGVVFLAFQGSRFTAQFASGYMSYAINVGTKFFVFYFVLAIVGGIYGSIGGAAATAGSIAAVYAAAATPFGAGSIVAIALSAPAALMALVCSGLIAAVPNFAGSILSGSSALSASAAMGQLSSAISGASGIMEANKKAGKARNDAREAADASAHDHFLADHDGTLNHRGQTGARLPKHEHTGAASTGPGLASNLQAADPDAKAGGLSPRADAGDDVAAMFSPPAGGNGSADAPAASIGSAGGNAKPNPYDTPPAAAASANVQQPGPKPANAASAQSGPPAANQIGAKPSKAPATNGTLKTGSQGNANPANGLPVPPAAAGPRASNDPNATRASNDAYAPRTASTAHVPAPNGATPDTTRAADVAPEPARAAGASEPGPSGLNEPAADQGTGNDLAYNDPDAAWYDMGYKEKRAALRADDERLKSAEKTVAEADEAASNAALLSMGQFMPKGEQAAAPVQIRMTNSDKPS